MFGYVVPDRPELKIKELECYQSYYCGLCQSLKKRHHSYATLSLNYDMTFLGLLLTALFEPDNECYFHRCMVHGARKRKVIHNQYIDYAADMNVLLTYYKCLDDWKDEHRILGISYARVLRHSVKEIAKKYPKKADVICTSLQKLSNLEKDQFRYLDLLAGCFGSVCAEIFCYDDQFKELLHDTGYYLGKFIYLFDAYDDWAEDQKKGCYNPLNSYHKRQDFEQWIYEILNMTIAQACRAFEKLPIIEHVEILKNILYAGVWGRYDQIQNRGKI